MSILACLIGILTLMISVSMQVQEQEQKGFTEQERNRAREQRELLKKVKKLKLDLKEKNKELEESKSTVSAMAKLQDKKIILQKKLEESEIADNENDTNAELQKRLENMENEIAQLKAERPSLSQKLEKLKEELKKRKDDPRTKKSVVIKPRGLGKKDAKEIFFVECNSTGIILSSKKHKGKTITTSTIRSSDIYAAFLDRVRTTKDSMILFLVRKSGNSSYAWAAGIAESKYEVLTGKLPVPNDGKIDLSLFKK